MILFILLYLFCFQQYEVTILGYEILDGKVCDIVISKNRGTMIKFHAAAFDPKCKGLVRFKQENATYCIPIIDGKNDILHCPVSLFLLKVAFTKSFTCFTICDVIIIF